MQNHNHSHIIKQHSEAVGILQDFRRNHARPFDGEYTNPEDKAHAASLERTVSVLGQIHNRRSLAALR